jgi:hypothetical protein
MTEPEPGMAEAILRKLLDRGYVNLDLGVLDATGFSVTPEEEAYLRLLLAELGKEDGT